MHVLNASVFTLPEPSRRSAASELWAEMAEDLKAESPERYVTNANAHYRICIKDECLASPDRLVVRYRTIEAAIRRRAGRPTLLDLSVGNLFSPATSRQPEAIHIVNDPRYAQWARHASQVSLQQHVRLSSQFIEDLLDAGWAVEPANLKPVNIPAPRVSNGDRTCSLPTEKFAQLARRPAAWPSSGVDIAIVAYGKTYTEWAASQVQRAMEALFGQAARWRPRISLAAAPEPGSMNLVLIDEQLQLEAQPEVKAALRAAEAAGICFKLARPSSLGKTYPAQNIVYDMFQIAGGKPWLPAEPQSPFCSVDAGHKMDQHKSRWVTVETNAQHAIVRVRAINTALAEHIPQGVLSQLWPVLPNSILCRDGRLSKERGTFESRVAAEGRAFMEAKKSPKAVLWRGSSDDLAPAQFGDGVIDDHGDLLLQTVKQDANDYIHPVRLTCQRDEGLALATEFLHQQAVPGLSLYRQSRLPGALYFADLVSKLTADGWTKVVGRGFKVPQVVP